MNGPAEFRALVDAHQDRAFRAALRVLGNRDDALDATQEAFLALHRHLDSVRQPSVGPWLERVATNAAIDQLRKRRSDSTDEPPPSESADPGPLSMAETAEDRQRLRAALCRLPDRQREVVTMRTAQQLTFGEIRRILGISDGAAKMHFRRAMRALTTMLYGAGGDR